MAIESGKENPVTFQIRTEKRGTVSGLDPTVWILEGDSNRAEIWPARGFNCFCWTVEDRELLYADPQFLEGSSPTRTGIPILFPFPNRIRDGRFAWEGRDYQLPINDPQKKNAIHGFACQRVWRIVDQGTDAASVWITGEFHGSRDAPECRSFWPADYRIRITYRLRPNRLRIEATVDNPDQVRLPFGLGYHPYFRVTGNDSSIQVPAGDYWELQECLPSGTRVAVTRVLDLNQPRPFAELTVDDVLTGLPNQKADGLCFRGSIRDNTDTLEVLASPSFREAVVFTPPHRHAFCLEPYTCATDAINLQQHGIDAGLIVLPPGQSWNGVVELHG
jgi:aldose 1-epimerase